MVHIVDDDVPIRDSAGLHLKASGFPVVTFPSAAGYIASDVVGKVDCMLVRYAYARMTGITLLNTVRSKRIVTAKGLHTARRLKKQIRRRSAMTVVKRFRAFLGEEANNAA